jgi:hypothetical protein
MTAIEIFDHVTGGGAKRQGLVAGLGSVLSNKIIELKPPKSASI